MTALLLAALLLAAEPDPAPCASAPPACRQAAAEAILTWRTEALVAGRHLQGCEERLATRTATVVRELVPVPIAVPAEPTWWTTGAIGAAALALGVVLGVVVAR